MFTVNGIPFGSVTIARLVASGGFEHIPAAVDGLGGCSWLIETYPEWADGEARTYECGAEVALGDDRWQCAAGHSHVAAHARSNEGWDYAEDAFDAAVIHAGGREFVPMGATTHLDTTEILHALETIR